MTQLGPQIAYKIVPEESFSIIGSSSKDEPGELYTIEIKYNIAQSGQRRNKRVFDLGFCLFLLFTIPFWLLFSNKRVILLSNWLPVVLARRTWVGYNLQVANHSLPHLKTAVFSLLDGLKTSQPTEAMLAQLNFLYAKDWNVWRDLRVVWRNI
jgi:hypothetical protein